MVIRLHFFLRSAAVKLSAAFVPLSRKNYFCRNESKKEEIKTVEKLCVRADG